MDHQEHLKAMQQYVANIGITASTLRNLGGSGFVKKAREFLGTLDLDPLKTLASYAYPRWLDDRTEELKTRFGGSLWGPARKSINIFMTMASLNRILCATYALDRLENELEVPLDNVVREKLQQFALFQDRISEGKRPTWTSIKELDSENSKLFQEIAKKLAADKRIPRGQLDVALWEPIAYESRPVQPS
jgi:hypothetical protein